MGQLTIDAKGKSFKADLESGAVVLSFEIGLDPALRHREFLSHICESDLPLTLTIQSVQMSLDDAKPLPDVADDSLVTISANDESVTVRGSTLRRIAENGHS